MSGNTPYATDVPDRAVRGPVLLQPVGPDPGKEANPLHPVDLLVIVGPGPAWAPTVGGVRRRPTEADWRGTRVGRQSFGKLEVEFVDVRLVEHERRAEQDGTVRADGVLAKLARGEGLP